MSPLFSPLLVFGQQPAPPSIALREMEREEWTAGERRGTDEYSGGIWRGKEVQEEDAASTIRRTGEEGWETGQRGKEGRVAMEEEWKKKEGGFG